MLNERIKTREKYSKKLKDPRWQKKRLEIFQRDGWCCQNCGDKTGTLNVHHKIYRKSDPWEVPFSDLITLCESCHEVESIDRYEVERDLLRVLKKAGLLTNHLETITDYFEKQSHYFEVLEDEKWLSREKELLKIDRACFICHTPDELIIYHKSITSYYVTPTPWALPDSEFDFICKSCNRTNSTADIVEYFDFLIPAFRYAGYYREDIVDLVADDHCGKFIRLILGEIRKERLSKIPKQHLDSWSSRKNITYKQLMLLTKEVK